MANIALDIKANTSKALGEFKKLSRELDNKFLVQGLKLDVVKNAFRQINREFEQSLGQQGFDASQSTNKIQRNAAANLALLKNISVKSAFEVTKAVRDQLQTLQAEGKLTGEVVNQALNVAGAFTFSGSVDEIRAQKSALAKEFATLSQSLNTAFDSNITNGILNVLTGKASVDELQSLEFGPGGAGGNLLRSAILSQFAGFDSLVGEERTKAVEKIVKQFKEGNGKIANILSFGLREAEKDDPFTRINMELKGLFSPRGLFGNLRTLNSDINKEYKNFYGQTVDNNLLQLTADLVRTIFDKERGLFAILGQSLKEIFGLDPQDARAPVFVGVRLLTEFFESVGIFFASPQFKSILEAFKPFAEAIKGIKIADGITFTEINNFIDGIFEGIRGLFRKIGEFVKNIDAKSIGDVIGNFFGEIIASLPDLLVVVFNSITKLIDVVISALNSDGFNEGKIGTVLATFIDGLAGLIPKVVELISTALPKLASSLLSAFNEADAGGKALIAGALGEGLLRIFTGKGIFGNVVERVIVPIKDSIGRGIFRQLEKIPGVGGLLSKGENERAAGGSDRQRWGRLFEILDRIKDCVCGGGLLGAAGDLLDGPGRGRGRGRGSRFSRRGDGGFSTRRGPRPRGPRIPGIRPRISGGPRGPLRSLLSISGGARVTSGGATPGIFSRLTGRVPQLTGGVASRIPPIPPGSARITGGAPVRGIRGAFENALKSTRNFFNVGPTRITGSTSPSGFTNLFRSLRSSVSTLTDNAAAQSRILRNQFRAGFNKPNVAIGTSAAPSRAFRAGEITRNLQRGAQNLPRQISTQASRGAQNLPRQISTQASRATQATRGIPEATRGLNARMMGTTPGAAARYTSRFGQFAGARRGLTSVLGRAALPLLAASTIFGAASILGTPGAKAEELEEKGYTKDEIEQIRKQEKRDKTRGLTGIGASLAGGAAGGAAGAKLGGLIGTFFGPGLGTAIGAGVGGVAGGVLGSIFGEQAVNALSDPIIDGITNFGEGVGSFFSDLWNNISSGFSSALEGLGKFFGSEGPIQRFAKWYFSLPGNIASGVFGAITGFFGEDGPIQKVGGFFMDLPGKVAETLGDAWNNLTSALVELPGTILKGAFGWMGGALPKELRDVLGIGDEEEKDKEPSPNKDKEPSPNFAGGFSLIGGRTSFNEREAIGMPDGVTYIPLSSSTSLEKFVGKTVETTNNMEVTINVSGAADPRQVAQAVIEEIDNVFKSVTSTT